MLACYVLKLDTCVMFSCTPSQCSSSSPLAQSDKIKEGYHPPKVLLPTGVSITDPLGGDTVPLAALHLSLRGKEEVEVGVEEMGVLVEVEIEVR